MFPRQDSTLSRLQDFTGKRLKKTKDASALKLKRLWNEYRAKLKGNILASYAPSTAGFNRTKYAMAAQIRATMQQFHAHSVPLVKKAVKDLHSQSVLLHSWMLDQVTPENIKINIPTRPMMREADIIEDPLAFDARWSSWLDAYNSALSHNVMMNAINENTFKDAVDEVDQTKANTPAYSLIDAMNRIFEYEAQGAINLGAMDVAGANDEATEEEIWRTRGDLRVCDDCDSNEGMAIEDVGIPPLHPNCHCFTEIVPASFADLLRSGDEDDWELARQMDREGVVPNALIIRDGNGDIAAKTVVSFNQWQKGNSQMVMGR